MYQFDRVLAENEQILWIGRPRLGAMTLSRSLLIFPFILFGLMLIIVALFSKEFGSEYAGGIQNKVVFIGIGAMCVLASVAAMVTIAQSFAKVAYAVTTQRLLFQRAGKGGSYDMVSIPFAEVKDMQLNQGIVDLVFGGGTKSVLFSTTDSYQYHRKYGWEYKPKRFEHVPHAAEALRHFQAAQPRAKSSVAGGRESSEPIIGDGRLEIGDSGLGMASDAAQSVPLTSNSPFLTLQDAPSPFLPQQFLAPRVDSQAIPPTLSQIVRPNEHILWHGKPKRGPFLLHFVGIRVALLLFLVVMIWSFIADPGRFIQSLDKDSIQAIAVYLFLVVAPVVYRVLVYARVYYVVTDQRVLAQGGVIGMDVEAFERQQITQVATRGDMLDRLFGGNSATVVLETYNRKASSRGAVWWAGNELQHIEQAGVVQQLLQPQPGGVVGDRDSASFVPTNTMRINE